MSIALKFLNDNSGAFNVLFSSVVAVATVVYAVLTARLVRETERLRSAATEPALEVTYRSRDEAMALLDVVLTNIGSGPAYQIRISFAAEPAGPGAEALLKPLRELKSFKSGINVLLPGQEFSSYWNDVRKEHDGKLQTRVTVTTVCRGSTGIEYKREHVIDLSELQGVSRLGTPPLLAMARHLEKLAKDVGDLTSGWRRLRVDAFTQNDREREQAEWEAQRAQFQAEQQDEKAQQAPPLRRDG